MTRQTINRLGVISYAVLIWGIVNGSIQRELSREIRESLLVLIPRIAVSFVAVIALFYCEFCFIRHLFTENKQVGFAGKALWLVLLLLGSAVTMPAYWYLYIVRERLANAEQNQSELPGPVSLTPA